MAKVWLNNLNCSGREKHLWECPGPPGMDVSVYTKDMVKRITCSEEVELRLNGYKCAGAVYYTKKPENSSTYFCNNWDQGDRWANYVCDRLNCGKLKEPSDLRLFNENTLPSDYNRVSTQCTSSKQETHPWQCDPQPSNCNNPAVVICEGHDVWRIQGGSNRCSGKAVHGDGSPVSCGENATHSTCDKMRCGTFIKSECDEQNNTLLSCSDNITIFLKNNASGENATFGEVHVAAHPMGAHPMGELPVCASKWKPENSKVVCKELGFGAVIGTSFVKNRTKGILDDVMCSGDEASLWDCKAKYSKAKDKPLQCNHIAMVTCGACIRVRLSDGPGRCAGRLEMKVAGMWNRVGKRWTAANSHVVCQELDCGNALPNLLLDQLSPGSLPFLNKMFDCPQQSQNMSNCVGKDFAPKTEDQRPTMLVCEDHLEVFVKGSSWCEGQVGVRQHDSSYWLSGSAATWTQTAANKVCQQMHCGSAMSHRSILFHDSTIPGEKVWPREYSCSSKEKSLFDCPLSDTTDNSTIAFVTCAGKVMHV
ncbi:unnamed protein product [Lota lota]